MNERHGSAISSLSEQIALNSQGYLLMTQVHHTELHVRRERGGEISAPFNLQGYEGTTFLSFERAVVVRRLMQTGADYFHLVTPGQCKSTFAHVRVRL
jgi:hypothetical protein